MAATEGSDTAGLPVQPHERSRPVERLSAADEADLAAELSRYAALEGVTAAVEDERRSLARRLETEVVAPLNLLLAQAGAYEAALGADPQTRMAVSVLAGLARQVLQQVRDLESDLRPNLLGALGLEPALEALADRARRTHGVPVLLAVERQRERPPAAVELALLRAAQDALERAVRQARATRVTVQLARRGAEVTLRLCDDGAVPAGAEALRAARQRTEQLGGTFTARALPGGGLEMTVVFSVAAPVELTAREREVLQLLAKGLSNKQIARALNVRPRTVNYHLDHVYSKLGVNSRLEAVLRALRLGLIRAPGNDLSE